MISIHNYNCTEYSVAYQHSV